MESIKKERYKDHEIEIKYDLCPDDPRECYDNFGHMICFHKRYNLGDKTHISSNDFNSWDEMEEYLRKDEGAVIIYPLYLYDHSGLRLKIGDFYGLLPQGHAYFDSGQVGFIYCTAKDIKDNFKVKKVTKKILEKSKRVLEGEVISYDKYLSGQVYYYEIFYHGDFVDSCGQYDDIDEAIKDAKGTIEGKIEVEEAMKDSFVTLKGA